MNNTFNINRFGLLLRRQWLDFGKVYLISLVVLVLSILSLYYFNMPREIDYNFRWDDNQHVKLFFKVPIFLTLGFIFISVISSTYFSSLGQKDRAIVELISPTSTLEKFLSAIFYTSIISIISYLLAFYLVDKVFNIYLDFTWQHQKILNYRTNLLITPVYSSIYSDIINERSLHFYSLPFIVNSIFLLGSIYFKKFHYLKTAICSIGFIIAVIGLILYTMSHFTKNTVWIGNDYWQKEENILYIISLSGFLLSLAIWFVVYVRLIEKEV